MGRNLTRHRYGLSDVERLERAVLKRHLRGQAMTVEDARKHLMFDRIDQVFSTLRDCDHLELANNKRTVSHSNWLIIWDSGTDAERDHV